jgi:hypothetical protein
VCSGVLLREHNIEPGFGTCWASKHQPQQNGHRRQQAAHSADVSTRSLALAESMQLGARRNGEEGRSGGPITQGHTLKGI